MGLPLQNIMPTETLSSLNEHFMERHIGPNEADIQKMLSYLGYKNLDSFIGAVVPSNIRLKTDLKIGLGLSERETLFELKEMSRKNRPF
jgi:glycine dehydrogenase